MMTTVKRLILRTIERAGYVVLKRDARTDWHIRFDGSQLRYDNDRSSGRGHDARTAAQFQAVLRELMSAREAAARAEIELEKARAKLWQLGAAGPQAPCRDREGSEGWAASAE
jgi:hypothetical protein